MYYVMVRVWDGRRDAVAAGPFTGTDEAVQAAIDLNESTEYPYEFYINHAPTQA